MPIAVFYPLSVAAGFLASREEASATQEAISNAEWNFLGGILVNVMFVVSMGG